MNEDAAGPTASDAQSPQAADDSLFLEREEMFTAEYDAVGVTYETNDMGLESYWFPPVVQVSPRHGLWIVDDRTRRTEWRLIRIDTDGEPVFSTDLVASLGLDTPGAFYPQALTVLPDGRARLLSSRRVETGEDGDKLKGGYTVTTFSPDGDLVSTRALSDVAYSGTAFVTDAGTVFTLVIDGPSLEWWQHGASGEPTLLAETAPRRRPARIADGIVERLDDDVFRLLRANGDPATLRLRGGSRDHDDRFPVSGDGSYFGYVVDRDPYETVAPGSYETKRRLHLLYHDAKRQAVYSLGTTELAPATFVHQDSGPGLYQSFTVFFPDESHLDAEGNFYEIAWSRTSLAVYRYPLDTDHAASVIERRRTSADRGGP